MDNTQQITDGKHEEMKSSPLSQIQREIARERPRDAKAAVEKALNELAVFPEFAAKAYYSIPYKDNRTQRTVFVEGPSIKAARAMKRYWGNSTSAWRVAEEREDRVICEGLFYDYETNNLEIMPSEVMRFYRTKEGKLVRRDANQIHLAIQAAGSKAARNAILAGLPTAFVEMYFAEAKRIAVEHKTGPKKKSVQESIHDGKLKLQEKYGAMPEEIEKLIQARIAEADGDFSEQDILAFLLGIWNALKDGANPDQVFLRPPATAAGGVSMPQGTDE